MDYKTKYDSIPEGYKKDVLKIAGLTDRNALTRYFKKDNPRYVVSVDRAARIESAINQVWKPHNLAKQIDVTLGTKIIADHPTATEYIKYCELTSFKIQLTGTLGDYESVEDALINSENDMRQMQNENPYDFKLLIAKYILHDTRTNY